MISQVAVTENKNRVRKVELFSRQIDAKRRSCAECRIHRNLAAVESGEMFDDGEAETRAADLARAGTVGPVKSLKDSLQMFGQNAFAGVGD